jgi:lipid-A-disaccharide synthase
MVTFYRVSPLTWKLGRFLVDVPFYSMVNLIAGRALVPELMQDQMTGPRLAAETLRLLGDERAKTEMKVGLAEVKRKLTQEGAPAPQRAAALIQEILEGQIAHAS